MAPKIPAETQDKTADNAPERQATTISSEPTLDRGTNAETRATSGSRSRLVGAAIIMMAAYVASRATGLLRDIAISYQFGTTREYDAYLAAIRIPDLVFQVTAGGAVASAFIPVFAAYLARDELEEGWRMVSTLFNLSVVVLTPIILLLIAFAPGVMRLIAPDFEPQYQMLAGHLARILLISPLFFTIGCFTTGVLNSHQRFFLAALAPTAYNLGIIAGALGFARYFGIEGLALGAAVGSFLFLLVQLPGLVQVGMRYRPVLDLRHPGVREVGKLMAPRTVGLAVVQINFIVTLYLASAIPGGVGSLNYAWLLTMLPLGVFAMAISSAVFPALAALTSRDEHAELRRTVAIALRFILFLTIPAAVGLVLLAEPIVRVLYQRGVFTPESTAMTVNALRYYAPGLVGMATVEIVTRVFYAYHDTRTPVIVAGLAMIVNGAFAFSLVGVLSYGGLALATALASTLEALCLGVLVERKLPGLLDRGLLDAISRFALAALPLAIVIGAFQAVFGRELASAGFLIQAVALVAAIGLGGAVYLGAAVLLRVEEVGRFRQLIRR